MHTRVVYTALAHEFKSRTRALAARNFIMSTVTYEAMERSTSLPTGSSQNQPTGSFQSHQPGSFENQPLIRQRKRGIAALLGDTTNLPAADASLQQRACKQTAKYKIAASSLPEFDQRGDSLKGVKTKQQKHTGSNDDTLYRIFKNNREVLTKGRR